MDNSTRPLFCSSDNYCTVDTAGKCAVQVKCPASGREEASKDCILKDIDWDLSN